MTVAETKGVVVRAFIANLAIALAKFLAYAASGSAAMLAEAFHSTADTFNQVLLYLGIRLEETPPDEEHPFGYGRDRFFWSFLAAVFIFFAGGVVAVREGVSALLDPAAEAPGALGWSYGVLAFALLSDGWILIKAHGALQRAAALRKIPLWRLIRTTKDPTTITVFFEDSAATFGVLLAAAGIALTDLTGNVAWDATASILIGLILMAVGIMLAYETRSLLLGEAATPAEREEIRQTILASPYVEQVPQLLTMHLSPDQILVTGHVVLRENVDVEEAARELRIVERKVRLEVEGVQYIFLGICEPPLCPTTREQAAEQGLGEERRAAS